MFQFWEIINLCHFCFFFFKNFGEHTNTSKVSIQTDTSPKNSLKHSQIICYFTTNFIEIRQIVRFRRHCRKTKCIILKDKTHTHLRYGNVFIGSFKLDYVFFCVCLNFGEKQTKLENFEFSFKFQHFLLFILIKRFTSSIWIVDFLHQYLNFRKL